MFALQVLVVRENFQDLYLVLKERHKHLDSRKQKVGYNRVEDVKRHVWKVCLRGLVPVMGLDSTARILIR
jgi:hypothetical protein